MGTINTQNYTLGMPDVYFTSVIGSTGIATLTAAVAGSDTYAKEYYSMGNAADCSLAVDATFLDHWVVAQGIRGKDKTVCIERALTFDFTFDEFTPENLIRFMYGAQNTLEVTDTAPETVGTADDTTKTFTCTLANTPIVKGSVTIDTASWDATEKGAGVFTGSGVDTGTIDYMTGALSITYDTAPSTGDDPEAAYTYIDFADVFNDDAVGEEGSALFVFETSIGKDFRYYVPKCTIKPSGNIAFGAEDWMTGTFTVEVLKDSTFTYKTVDCHYGYLDLGYVS